MSSKNGTRQGGGGIGTDSRIAERIVMTDAAVATMMSDVTMHSHVESSLGAPASNIIEAMEPVSRSKKLVNVTVTVLSIAGLFVKDDRPAKKKGGLLMKSKKFPSRGGGGDKADENGTVDNSMPSNDDSGGETAAPSVNSTTTIVASFSRLLGTKDGKPKTVMTHVPSLPLPLLQIGGKKKATNSVVRWPEQPREEGENNNGIDNKPANWGQQALSSYQFQRTFQREEAMAGEGSASGDRFVPQPLSVQIAISRSGRMFKLGTADILISGEESGESSINMPIKNCNPQAVVPKTNKRFKTRKGNNEKMIPMMKLKGDTLKCGLDPDATLRVLVHVGEPIGETMEISPKFNVTMISNSMRSSKKGRKKKMREPRLPNQPGHQQQERERLRPERPVHQENEAVVAASATARTSPVNTDVGVIPSAMSWEYNPTLAAVVVKSPGNDAAGEDEDDGPLLRVIASRQEEEDPTLVEEDDYEEEELYTDDEEEPSCTSSAYMSVDQYRRSYPSKHKQHDLSAHSRSYSTATTTTSLSSVVSDLTETHSWLSQTGIEVIPFAPNMADLPLNSRLRLLEEGDSLVAGRAPMGGDTCVAGAKTAGTTTTTGGGRGLGRRHPSLPTRSSSDDAIVREKKQTWRQRLVCGFVPTCGGGGGASDLYEVDSYLSAVNEEDVASSTNQYLPRCVDGGGMAGHSVGQNTNRSYYTEYTEDSGTSSFIYDDSSADSSESSSVG